MWAVGGYSQTGETVKEEKAQKLELAQHFGEQERGEQDLSSCRQEGKSKKTKTSFIIPTKDFKENEA